MAGGNQTSCLGHGLDPSKGEKSTALIMAELAEAKFLPGPWSACIMHACQMFRLEMSRMRFTLNLFGDPRTRDSRFSNTLLNSWRRLLLLQPSRRALPESRVGNWDD